MGWDPDRYWAMSEGAKAIMAAFVSLWTEK